MKTEECLNMFPLTVKYPGTGIRYVLQWHTHNEQNHCIVARTERAVEVAFRRVLEKGYPDIRISGYNRVELVAPHKKIQTAYAIAQKTIAVQSFWSNLAYLALPNIDNLPNGLQKCTCKNRQCKKCWVGIRPTEGTLESVWLQKRNPKVAEKGSLSRARKATSTENLLVVGSGTHGCALQQAKGYALENVQFFCVESGLTYSTTVYKMLEEYHAKAEERKSEKRQLEALRLAKRNALSLEELRKIFP